MWGEETQIIASIQSDFKNNLQKAKKRGADAVEIRIDLYDGDAINDIKKTSLELPVIATNRPKWEGGKFNGDEKERINILEEISHYVDFIDLEFKMENSRQIADKLKNNGVNIILSYHNFKETPSQEEMQDIINDSLEIGDIAKLAVKAKTHNDTLDVLEVICKNKGVCILAMGEKGSYSRFLGPVLGSSMTYTSLDGKTAPGQLNIQETKRGIKLLNKCMNY